MQFAGAKPVNSPCNQFRWELFSEPHQRIYLGQWRSVSQLSVSISEGKVSTKHDQPFVAYFFTAWVTHISDIVKR